MIPIENNVGSFTIDHTNLYSGIYIAREGNGFTTYDLRVTSPNKEPAMDPSGAHSMEHLLATWFRNSRIKEHVVALDGMMCLTGFYLILDYKLSELEVRDLMIEALNWILNQTEVPATEPATCGNYLLHNLDNCKFYAEKYLHWLIHDFSCEYKKLQVVTKDGLTFQDS